MKKNENINLGWQFKDMEKYNISQSTINQKK